MSVYKVMYISGSIGLGNVIKDLAIANKLRTINPDGAKNAAEIIDQVSNRCG